VKTSSELLRIDIGKQRIVRLVRRLVRILDAEDR